MNRKQIVIGIVGILVGFILGFFVAMGTQSRPVQTEVHQHSVDGELPENHPSPEEMERLQELIQRVDTDPSDVESRIALGNAYYDMGRFDAAIPLYEEVLGLDKENVNVSTDLGTAYLYTGDFEKAVDCYKRSLMLEPDHPQTLQNLGIAYFSSGRYQDSLDNWQRLVSVHPDYVHIEDVKQQIETARAHLNVENTNSSE